MKTEERKWFSIDAKNYILGDLATKVAITLRGKNKVNFTPHLDQGDYVVVLNASGIKVTGDKLKKKLYYTHSRHIGSLKTINLQDLLEKDPISVIRKAVLGMLPKNKLRKRMASRLKVYADESHTHEAQKITPLI